MSRSMVLILLIVCMLTALFPAASVSAQPRKAEDAAIQGVVTLDRRFVTITSLRRGEPLRVIMRFDPQDQNDLRQRSGFFLLDGEKLRAVYDGGSPFFNNIAAGEREIDRPDNELVATIGQANGEYAVVIYNDTTIPMNFRLSVENGAFPMEIGEPQPSVAQPEVSNVQPPVENVSSSADVSLGDMYTVKGGDSLSLIAETLYGDFQFYRQLCAYNKIDDCNIINVGQTLRTPPLGVLTNADLAVPVVREVITPPEAIVTIVSTPVSVGGNFGTNYTVVAGDTLSLIADRVFGDFERFREICSFNSLPDCNSLSVGQVIRIPTGDAAQSAAVVANQPAPPPAPAPPTIPAPAPLPAATNAPVAVVPAPISTPIPIPTITPTPTHTVTPNATSARPAATATPMIPTESSETDVASVLKKSPDKSIFLLLWDTAGLTEIMKGSGPLTVFVPHDAAFVLALQANLKTWMADEQILKQILTYHAVAQAFDPNSLANGPVTLTTLAGTGLTVERTSGGLLKINGARVIGAPITASNGQIYTIDQLLSPPDR